jgi:16S rRNA (guanine527-N7)-methyltransferase
VRAGDGSAGGKVYEELLRGRLLGPCRSARLGSWEVDGTTCERLARFAVLVERWSARHSLVRFGSREELVDRHLVESLAGLELIGRADEGGLLDVGSGAGLPGVPILIASGLDGVLVEPRAKRWSFLRMVVRELELECSVVRERFEALDDRYRGFAVITARAVGRSRELVAWARSRLGQGGAMLLWTDEERAAELGVLEGWHVLSSRVPGRERGRLLQLRPCFT